jgi:hypothetical protein
MDKDSKSNNKSTQMPKLTSWDVKSIQEYFESIGMPIKDVTDELAGTTSIIGLNKPSGDLDNKNQKE